MIFKPPMNISKRDFTKKSVFLAGTIDGGTLVDGTVPTVESENWQDKVTDVFIGLNWNVFNPRRDDWDKTWGNEFESPQFNQQVNWELNALDASDIILLHLLPNSTSIISMLELGLYAKSAKIYVVCSKGFFRDGNVEVVCNRFSIPLFETLTDFMKFFTKNHDKL